MLSSGCKSNAKSLDSELNNAGRNGLQAFLVFVCYIFVAFEPCFPFQLRSSIPFRWPVCNAILYWFSTRQIASDLVRNFCFIYIMCTFASG